VKPLKKTTITILLTTILLTSLMLTHAFCANTDPTSAGPAPNYHDGVSDGSGYDMDDWPNEDAPAPGPAPNAGDGIPDGSGF
jgi:hypothetical protein